ncbi:MAG: hypothetical protein QGF59_12425, partial [Pirellulaceae bacterium]|nr:hypothetical protein [Pirellulaceae bacterium]
WRGATREWSVGCNWNAWFTRAEARAYAACGGMGRKRPWSCAAAGTQCAGNVSNAEMERGGAGRRENGTRWRGATWEWNVGCSSSAWFTRPQGLVLTDIYC